MKLKLLALISILSIGLLCACKGGDKPSQGEDSSVQTSEVAPTSNGNPVTSNGNSVTSNDGHDNPNTSNGNPVTSGNTPVSSGLTTSKDPSNPNIPLSNGEGGIASWDDVGNI